MEDPSAAEERTRLIHPLLQLSLCASALSFALAGLPDILFLLRGGQDPSMPTRPPWAPPPRAPMPKGEPRAHYDFFLSDDGTVQPGGPRPGHRRHRRAPIAEPAEESPPRQP